MKEIMSESRENEIHATMEHRQFVIFGSFDKLTRFILK
jgi:hypothetical protein